LRELSFGEVWINVNAQFLRVQARWRWVFSRNETQERPHFLLKQFCPDACDGWRRQ
jgi:hypothetical protein